MIGGDHFEQMLIDFFDISNRRNLYLTEAIDKVDAKLSAILKAADDFKAAVDWGHPVAAIGVADSMNQDQLSAEASQALLDLANGKYDAEVAGMDKILAMVGAYIPQVLIAKSIIDAAIALNRVTAPLHVALGEGGSWVSITNSRVMPDGSLRPYDPAIDG